MIPELLVELVKRFEGFARVVRVEAGVPVAVPYRCPAGFWTIGYGELCQPDHPPLPEPEGARRLREVLLPVYVGHALVYSVILAVDERKLAAVADFIYNLGASRYKASTLRRYVNQERWQDAADELRKWVYGGGRVLPGLVKRREAERTLLLS